MNRRISLVEENGGLRTIAANGSTASAILGSEDRHALSDKAELASLVRRQLDLLGEDAERPGLIKTPDRVAESLTWLTRGYQQDVREVIGDALFEETHESMVMVRDIELYSLCEHHMLPFFGTRPHRLHPERPHRRACRSSRESWKFSRDGSRSRSG